MALLNPYYDRDGITIYNADCRELLPHLQANILLTDPPYGMKWQSHHRKVRLKKIAGDTELPLDLINAAIGQVDHAAYCFCRWNNLTVMPPPKSVLAWVKNNFSAGDLYHAHGRQWEAICFYAKEQHQFVKRISDVIHCPITGNKNHPTEKPLLLLRKIIAANVGDVVLDPFVGSGSTLLAAKLEGRKAIGIELDPSYCAVAVRRLELAAGCLF